MEIVSFARRSILLSLAGFLVSQHARACDDSTQSIGSAAGHQTTQTAGIPANAAIYQRQSNGSYRRIATYNIPFLPPGRAAPVGTPPGGGGGGNQQQSQSVKKPSSGAVTTFGCEEMLPWTIVTASVFSSFGFMQTGGGGFTTLNPQNREMCGAALASLDELGCGVDDGVRPRSVNGCGSGGADVPDYSVSAPTAGNIFTAACNAHDLCYGSFGSVKEDCDLKLGNAMRAVCAAYFDPNNPGWAEAVSLARRAQILSGCNLQSQAYETGLMSSTFQQWLAANLPSGWGWAAGQLPSAQDAFDAAQKEDACRDARAKKAQYCGR